MNWKNRSMPAALALATTILLTGAEIAQGQSVPNGTKCSASSQYKLAWEMPLRSSDIGQNIRSVIGRSEFSPVVAPRGATDRLAVGRAPDGTVALQMNIPKGKNENVNFRLGQFREPGADAVCLSVRIYLESGFQWPTNGGTKLGWGLWGGSKYDSAGGTKPSDQQGWTVRNVNNGRYGFSLYSYNLNRSGNHGQQSSPIGKLSTGRWHTIDFEVVMNNPGRSDGYTQAWMDGGGRKTMTNLQFRKNSDWAIRGLMFNDMFGGNVNDPKNWSPKAQNMWYADYKLYTRNGTAVSSSQSSSSPKPSTSSGSGATSGGSSGDVAKLQEDLRIAENRLRIAQDRYRRGDISASAVRNREADVAAAKAALNGARSTSAGQSSESNVKTASSGATSGGSSGDVAKLQEDLRIAENRLRIAQARYRRGDIPASNVRNREADVADAEGALNAATS